MGANDYTFLVLKTILSTTSRHLDLLAVREPEAAKTGPSWVASTEVVCLVNLLQAFDVLLSQVHNFRIACAQSQRWRQSEGPQLLTENTLVRHRLGQHYK